MAGGLEAEQGGRLVYHFFRCGEGIRVRAPPINLSPQILLFFVSFAAVSFLLFYPWTIRYRTRSAL